MLDVAGAAAVLEIVDALVSRERILDSAEVYPDVRVLVDEERSPIDEFVAVDFLPLVGRGPRQVALRSQRMGWRTQPEYVQKRGLIIALPSVRQKTTLRRPPVGDRRAAVAGPSPVRPAVKRVGERPYLLLVFTVPIKIRSGGEHAGQQESGIDGGQLANARAPPGRHVEKVIEEALVPGRVRVRALRGVAEEPQCRQSPVDCTYA